LERHRNSHFQTNKIGQCHRGALETRESGHEPRMPRHTEAMVDRTRRFPRAAVRGRCAPASPRRRAANDRLLSRGWGAHAVLFLLAGASCSRGKERVPPGAGGPLGRPSRRAHPGSPRRPCVPVSGSRVPPAATPSASACCSASVPCNPVCRLRNQGFRIADSLDTFYVLHWASDPRVRFIGHRVADPSLEIRA
jgi:hypothetical protein